MFVCVCVYCFSFFVAWGFVVFLKAFVGVVVGDSFFCCLIVIFSFVCSWACVYLFFCLVVVGDSVFIGKDEIVMGYVVDGVGKLESAILEVVDSGVLF